MEFEKKVRTSEAPNLTPLIDIVFLLLVFFMLTAHFVRDESISINLPNADSSEKYIEEEPIEVIIARDGGFFFSGKEIKAELMEQALKEALDKSSLKSVTIRGDTKSSLGLAVSVLDAARLAGAKNVEIVTEKP